MSRTARGLAAICAVAALGGAVASASAAPVTRGVAATHAMPARGATAVALEVFPTGDGPGDAEVCSSFGDNISHQQGVLVDDVTAGDILGALGQLEAISNLVDMAGDAGCAVIY